LVNIIVVVGSNVGLRFGFGFSSFFFVVFPRIGAVVNSNFVD
jgi:hypothetical protein